MKRILFAILMLLLFASFLSFNPVNFYNLSPGVSAAAKMDVDEVVRKHLEAIGIQERVGRNMEYVVIVEEGPSSIGAYVPDLPGCVSVGETREEAMRLIREAIELHIESLRENGEAVPSPHSFVEKVAV